MINNTYFSFCLRSASAADCEVSLPQHSSPECMAIRNAALAQNKKTFTLKQASHGFALLNMTIPELGAVALNDPFSSYYTRAYVGLIQINTAVLEQYNSTTFGQEITDISEYLKMSEFFQSSLEPAVGVSKMQSLFEFSFFTDYWKTVKDRKYRGVQCGNKAHPEFGKSNLGKKKRFWKYVKIIHKRSLKER